MLANRIELHVPSSRAAIAVLAVIGAAAVAAGVTLPWISFFAGLQAISALGTLNGWLLLAGAAASAALGIGTLRSPSRWLRRGLSVTAICLAAFAGYLGVQLSLTYRETSADPLLVAAIGPGLFVVGLGALLVLGTMFVAGD